MAVRRLRLGTCGCGGQAGRPRVGRTPGMECPCHMAQIQSPEVGFIVGRNRQFAYSTLATSIARASSAACYRCVYACKCSSEHGFAPHEKQSQRKDGLCLNAWHGPPRQASRQMTGVGSTSSFYGTLWRCEALRWFRRCAHTDARNRSPRIGSGCGCHSAASSVPLTGG